MLEVHLDHEHEVPAGCPSREQLAAFNVGKCAVLEMEAIATHLGNCRLCLSLLRTLDDEDHLVTELRGPCDAERFSDEERAQVVALVEAVGMQSLVHRSAAATVPAHEQTPAWTRTVGPYQLFEKLGRGAMGTVYKARDMALGKWVALRVLLPQRESNPTYAARFRREMQAVIRLSHPNIVQTIDVGEADSAHYLAMEMVEGVDLERVVHRLGPLSVPDVCELARQAAVGLEHIHENSLVHRDIRPSNLMLVSGPVVIGEPAARTTADSPLTTHHSPLTPHVKIRDLGLALMRQEYPTCEELTWTGKVAGNRDYLAPEQLDASHTADFRADIYSLGATLFKLLTGAAPARECWSRNAAGVADSSLPSSFVRGFRGDVPAEVLDALDRMMAINPDDRFQTAAAVDSAMAPHARGSDLTRLLSSALRLMNVTASSGELPSVGQPPRSRSRPQTRLRILTRATLFGLLIALVIALVVLLLHRF